MKKYKSYKKGFNFVK